MDKERQCQLFQFGQQRHRQRQIELAKAAFTTISAINLSPSQLLSMRSSIPEPVSLIRDRGLQQEDYAHNDKSPPLSRILGSDIQRKGELLISPHETTSIEPYDLHHLEEGTLKMNPVIEISRSGENTVRSRSAADVAALTSEVTLTTTSTSTCVRSSIPETVSLMRDQILQ
jgi:hypothetical protein